MEKKLSDLISRAFFRFCLSRETTKYIKLPKSVAKPQRIFANYLDCVLIPHLPMIHLKIGLRFPERRVLRKQISKHFPITSRTSIIFENVVNLRSCITYAAIMISSTYVDGISREKIKSMANMLIVWSRKKTMSGASTEQERLPLQEMQ